MPANVTLTLDTTGPAGVSASINSGAAYATTRPVTLTVGTSDSPTTGYQMKIWGDVDPAVNASIQATEGASAWITFATSQAVTLSTGDAVKTLNVRVRDDVWNESSVASDSITLDTTTVTVNITAGPTPAKISKVAGKNSSTVAWSADAGFDEYKVKVVTSTSSLHTDGTVIPTAGGSTNTSGATGGYPASTTITTTIFGADLESASAGDGDKIVKVFVRDAAGNWSV